MEDLQNKTFRAEIISNQSVQDDIIELLEQEIEAIQYTVIPDAQGRGLRSKKLGDSTWPEQNFVLYSYVKYEEAKKIKKIIEALRLKFPNEGICVFFQECVEL